jgi:hypothetical protein
VAVEGVGDEQGADAAQEHPERRRAGTAVDHQPDRGGEQQDVHDRVGHGDHPFRQGQPRRLGQRADQEHPGEHAKADGDDQGVQQAGAVGAGAAGVDQQQQPGHEERVGGQVEDVGHRREPLLPQDVLVGVEDDVGGDVGQQADREQPPGQGSLGPVPGDADRDGRHRRQPEPLYSPILAAQRGARSVAGTR